jgi:hypothetical protein
MNNLSPGDFKVVRDRYSLANEEGITHDDLIRALQDECRAKELNSPSIKIIGF